MSKSQNVALGLTAALLGSAWWITRDPEPDPTPQAVAKPAPAPPPAPVVTKCVISADGTDAVVFPTEPGLSAFRVAAESGTAIPATMLRHGGYSVPSGTSCEYVDRGFRHSQVLITSGAHQGRTAWLPTPWTRP